MLLNQIFSGVFDSGSQAAIALPEFLYCLLASLFIGLILSLTYMYRSKYTSGFVITLALIPASVCVVIMLVNGNIGAGVAVAGAFSLVRFRSVPGTAREIGAIFLAMGAGLATGMGYLAYGILFTVILCMINLIYTRIGIISDQKTQSHRTLRITIPEDLDYSEIFDDLFSQYTRECELIHVKTVNMGSLFRLTYDLTLNDREEEKEFIDALRCRNGNLEISSCRQELTASEL